MKRYFVMCSMVIAFVFCLNYNEFEKNFYPIHYQSYVEKYSKEYDVDPYLVYSIIKTESKFKEKAVSIKGASGLMQITKKTADWAAGELKIKDFDIFDSKTNIQIGIWYLKRLDKEFNGNLKLMISAYNGGSGNVRKWLNSSEYSEDGENLHYIPFRETSQYTDKVLKNYRKYRELYKD